LILPNKPPAKGYGSAAPCKSAAFLQFRQIIFAAVLVLFVVLSCNLIDTKI
jgi:hypothetical protein